MKTIGLLGGMSWESSVEYYRLINQAVRGRLGRLHSADCLMYSYDFMEIEQLQAAGDWETAAERMIEGGRRLERGGADCVMLCTNTMHKTADTLEAALDIPLIHIADPTAQAIKQDNHSKVALLGTAYTMEQDFYKGRLIEDHGLEVLVPGADDRKMIHDVIYDELVVGKIEAKSRAAYIAVIEEMQTQGAEGVILGCTEIGLLIKQADSPLPVYDTTVLHALAAVEFALAE